MAVQDYTDIFKQVGAKYGIDPNLLAAVVQQESGGNPNAVGPKTKAGVARGLAGILDSTASAAGVNSGDPAQAIDYLGRTLAANIKQHGDLPMPL